MPLEKTLKLKGIENRYPLIQGGMGIGISLFDLSSKVGEFGGIGTISSAALDQFTRKRLLAMGEKVDDVSPLRMDFVEATRREIYDTKKQGGIVAINIMVALVNYYEQSVQGAVEGGVNMIISGAGLPMNLPSLVEKYAGTKDHDVNLVPIISSGRALELICKKWARRGHVPDAVILEGPKAGGHLGWRYEQSGQPDFLEKFDLLKVLLPEVLDVTNKYKNDFGAIPVYVAGGIHTHEDIIIAQYLGATGVQIGTRFAMTNESGFSQISKDTILNATKEDIIIANKNWGSPCNLPFRYIKKSPLVKVPTDKEYFCICSNLIGTGGIDNTGKKGFPKGCPEGYVLRSKSYKCPATGTSSYEPIVTCGTEAYRINEIISTKDLMNELIHG